jgi:hypothetical protein
MFSNRYLLNILQIKIKPGLESEVMRCVLNKLVNEKIKASSDNSLFTKE